MPDFLDHFDGTYAPLLKVRASTFRAVLREAQHRRVLTVVETGSIRTENNWEGDGQSTTVLNHFMKFCGGTFTTIDLSVDASELTRKIEPDACVICGDGVVELAKFKGCIDLLYLDSFDLDQSNEHPAALHCMMEFTAALPKLHPGSIVCIDDSPISSDWSVTGKGKYVAQYMNHLGIRPFTFGYQVAWVLK